MSNKPKETNQKPAGGFLIAHFKRYTKSWRNHLRLFVEDEETGEKTYLQKIAKDRVELAKLYGTDRIRVKNKVYRINTVKAEPNNITASTMALGGVIGVVGGVPGVVIGGIIGGLLGKNSDDEDLEKANEFNGSKYASKS